MPERAPRIGVLSPVTGGFFFGEILVGVVREAARSGAHVSLIQTLDAGISGDVPLDEVGGARSVAWEHLDGFVVSAWAVGEDFVRRLRKHNKPVVLACSTGDVDARSVVVDNTTGIHLALDHLAGHGHTRIAFAGRTSQSDVKERYGAYLEHMPELGLPVMPLLAVNSDIDRGGFEAAELIAAQAPEDRATAVIAATDRVALGLISGLAAHGVRVPQDMAVVGFDDIAEGWYSDPPLTTVRQRFDDVGELAAATLLDELAGHPTQESRLSVPTSFVVRQSCGCDMATVEPSGPAAAVGEALVSRLEELLADAARSGVANRTSRESVEGLGAIIDAAVLEVLRENPTPEQVDQFLHTALETLNVSAAQDAEADLRRHVAARIAAAMTRHQATRDHRRVKTLSLGTNDLWAVGMGMLGKNDDPADLAWLEGAGVQAGCLALWDGPPSDGRVVIAGVHGPDGVLDDVLGTATTVEEFPPAELVDLADAAESLVAYVIPVRGPFGDLGLLCLVAPTEPEYATDAASYDRWAAFLGSALREKRLLAEVRHSEKRYAMAARATEDGLWEWDTTQGVYMSERCAELLGLGGLSGASAARALERVHEDDRGAVLDALKRAVAERDRPVEVEARLLRDDGCRWARMRAIGTGARDGSNAIVGSVSDIDERKQLEDQLREAALLDPVTGLANRRLFLDRLSVAMEQPRRRPGARFAVLFLDLDGFKLVNDSLGHLVGDDLLRIVGQRLRQQVRTVDTAARFGGDEFALLMTDPVPDDLLVVARRIQASIAEPVQLGGQEISITASVGIAASETKYADAEEVLRDADIAMYRAKESERGTACVFDPTMHRRAMDRLRDRSTITAALAANQFVVHYQPLVDLAGAGLTQFEALIRWEHPERGLLLPSTFLPAMEGNSAIITLGHQVIDQVCAQIAAWRAQDDVPVRVSVNLSHREFWNPELLSTVTGALELHGVPPECIVLEITEGVIMTDPGAAQEIMSGLHAAGLMLHIDDFGTGHSSLHALRTFPVDALKIDGSFIRDLGPERPTALVRAIVAMADALGLEVVAECVETPEQADQLREMGCETAQGWLYSRAVPPEEAGALLGRRLAAAPAVEPAS